MTALNDGWFTEVFQDQGTAFSLQVKKKLHEEQTPFQKLEIYEKYYNTRHLQERCEGPGQTVVINDYWVDSRSQKVWKSRQWAGPETGYLRIRDLSS